MQISITAGDGMIKSLCLDVSGFKVKMRGLEADKTLVITDKDGSIAVSITDASIIKEEISLPEQKSQEVPEAASPSEQEALKAASPPKQEAPKAASPPEQKVLTAVSVTEAEKSSSDVLFGKLSALRKRIAADAKLPAYTIFQDKSLHAMCEALPQDIQALKAIHGVGEARLAKYGHMFIEAIRQHLAA